MKDITEEEDSREERKELTSLFQFKTRSRKTKVHYVLCCSLKPIDILSPSPFYIDNYMINLASSLQIKSKLYYTGIDNDFLSSQRQFYTLDCTGMKSHLSDLRKGMMERAMSGFHSCIAALGR